MEHWNSVEPYIFFFFKLRSLFSSILLNPLLSFFNEELLVSLEPRRFNIPLRKHEVFLFLVHLHGVRLGRLSWYLEVLLAVMTWNSNGVLKILQPPLYFAFKEEWSLSNSTTNDLITIWVPKRGGGGRKKDGFSSTLLSFRSFSGDFVVLFLVFSSVIVLVGINFLSFFSYIWYK